MFRQVVGTVMVVCAEARCLWPSRDLPQSSQVAERIRSEPFWFRNARTDNRSVPRRSAQDRVNVHGREESRWWTHIDKTVTL